MKEPLFSQIKIALEKSIYLNRDCKSQKRTGINAVLHFWLKLVVSSIGILSGNDAEQGAETRLLCRGFAAKSNISGRNQLEEG